MTVLLDWLTLADYDKAHKAATRDIVARFSRGNVSVQNGQVLEEDELKELSALGDSAVTELNRLGRHRR